jgi:GLPGLI family protein
MKFKTYITLIVGFILSTQIHAQNFIKKAVVEYEVKTNLKKTMGNSSWAERMKDALPQFKTSYYKLTFANNQSVYRFSHWEANNKVPAFLRTGDENAQWYIDYSTGKMQMRKEVFGTNFDIEDSLTNIKWKFTNESREIAGFNCRKAVGVMMDSVYVFAFYTDELMLSGGPCSINGLPGVVLGLTVPRLYTSWIATSVSVTTVDENVIKPLSQGKKRMTASEVNKLVRDRTKDWIDDPDDPDSYSFVNQLLWGILL